jgi:hypothetical protein
VLIVNVPVEVRLGAELLAAIVMGALVRAFMVALVMAVVKLANIIQKHTTDWRALTSTYVSGQNLGSTRRMCTCVVRRRCQHTVILRYEYHHRIWETD